NMDRTRYSLSRGAATIPIRPKAQMRNLQRGGEGYGLLLLPPSDAPKLDVEHSADVDRGITRRWPVAAWLDSRRSNRRNHQRRPRCPAQISFGRCPHARGYNGNHI